MIKNILCSTLFLLSLTAYAADPVKDGFKLCDCIDQAVKTKGKEIITAINACEDQAMVLAEQYKGNTNDKNKLFDTAEQCIIDKKLDEKIIKARKKYEPKPKPKPKPKIKKGCKKFKKSITNQQEAFQLCINNSFTGFNAHPHFYDKIEQVKSCGKIKNIYSPIREHLERCDEYCPKNSVTWTDSENKIFDLCYVVLSDLYAEEAIKEFEKSGLIEKTE